MLNGLGYMLFGIPSRDLETTWYDVTQISGQPPKPGGSPLLDYRPNIATISSVIGTFLIRRRKFILIYFRLMKIHFYLEKLPNADLQRQDFTPEDESYILPGERKPNWKSKK